MYTTFDEFFFFFCEYENRFNIFFFVFFYLYGMTLCLITENISLCTRERYYYVHWEKEPVKQLSASFVRDFSNILTK